MVDGQKVKTLREKQNITQTQLGAACGVDQTMISKIEVGATDGTVATVKKIADTLGTTIDELLKKE